VKEYTSNWRIQPAKIIDDRQAKAIINQPRDPRDRLLLKVLAYSGLRVSEVVHIHRDEIYVDQGIFTAVRGKKKRFQQVSIDMPAEILQEMADFQTKGTWLFPGQSKGSEHKTCGRLLDCAGGHIAKRTAQRIWDAALKAMKMKVKGRGIHTLRHYHGTRFYAKTKDLAATQDRLGHSSPVMTRVYVDVVEMKKNVKKFGDIG